MLLQDHLTALDLPLPCPRASLLLSPSGKGRASRGCRSAKAPGDSSNFIHGGSLQRITRQVQELSLALSDLWWNRPVSAFCCSCSFHSRRNEPMPHCPTAVSIPSSPWLDARLSATEFDDDEDETTSLSKRTRWKASTPSSGCGSDRGLPGGQGNYPKKRRQRPAEVVTRQIELEASLAARRGRNTTGCDLVGEVVSSALDPAFSSCRRSRSMTMTMWMICKLLALQQPRLLVVARSICSIRGLWTVKGIFSRNIRVVLELIRRR